ncbi:RodZ domain-containing protein [Usitatibacter palustris]|uniref:Cytoskeleton protein RodZ n=1 Tax=Usitatibacter palustris TaxID=2732487 RepID=A0A6M4HB57_9PROT|nr:RodZ domain-containing protein [Usitatibacter palustris]QJR15704.1 Cytoskeleton protein RodZ [Usitatibacter palustris]
MESTTDPVTPAETPRTLGALLVAERERQALSRTDVAQRLHMSVSQVEALEGGDYARLPKGTFLRGFVRNYAKVLGLDPEAVLVLLAETAPLDKRPAIVVQSQNLRFDPSGQALSSPYVKATFIAVVAIVLGFAAMYWWLFIRPTPPAGATRKPAAEANRVAQAPAKAAPEKLASPPEPAKEPVQAEPVKTEPPAPPAPVKTEPAKAVPVKSAPPKTEPPTESRPAVSQAPIDTNSVLAAGGSVIRFKFRGNAWVEIKDARGKVLLSRNNPGGSETEVIGKPPFAVVVGNAPDVQMIYNNREFNLEPHTRVAVARFTLE